MRIWYAGISRLQKMIKLDLINKVTSVNLNLKSVQSGHLVFILQQTVFCGNLASICPLSLLLLLIIFFNSFTIQKFSKCKLIKNHILFNPSSKNKMGGQASVLNDPKKLINIQGCLKHIELSITQRENLSVPKLEKRKQTQVIKFKYRFVNFDPEDEESQKEQNLKIQEISESIIESNISTQTTWSSLMNQKSIIIENDHLNENDDIKIRSIKLFSDKNKKNIEFSENQIMIKINIESLQNRGDGSSMGSSIKQNSKIMEQDQKNKMTQQSGSQIYDYTPLKTLAFSYKSYSTRNILRQIVHQLITKKGIRQFVIIGPQQIDKSFTHMRKTFLSKILEVFYEIDQLIQIKIKKRNQDPNNKSKQRRVFQAKVLLVWKDLKRGRIEQQIKKIRNKMQIPIEQGILQ